LRIRSVNERRGSPTIQELQQALYFLIENQIQTRTLAKVKKEYIFKVISPALVPDDDKFIQPNRPFVIVFRFAVGLFLGIMAAFLKLALDKIRLEFSSDS